MKTEKSRFTRMCIGEALITLMEKMDINSISVTMIANKAGVSRMTYYKYYENKIEVLEDYLCELVNDYMIEMKERDDIGRFRDYIHICHSFSFFSKYDKFFLTLVKAKQYSIIIDAINEYMDYIAKEELKHSKYELYYYAGALCNTFTKWVDGGKKESVEEIAHEVYGFINKKET